MVLVANGMDEAMAAASTALKSPPVAAARSRETPWFARVFDIKGSPCESRYDQVQLVPRPSGVGSPVPALWFSWPRRPWVAYLPKEVGSRAIKACQPPALLQYNTTNSPNVSPGRPGSGAAHPFGPAT